MYYKIVVDDFCILIYAININQETSINDHAIESNFNNIFVEVYITSSRIYVIYER